MRFQHTQRPRISHDEAKVYFSQKHKLYGYKTEFSVTPDGQCVNYTKHYPGSAHDLTNCRKNMAAHKHMLKKKNSENLMPDNGELYQEYKYYWAMLVDKEYVGLPNN